ncbi:hypothetical protein ACWEFL_26730 [Streptomyces sp. NPDC004838]
MTTTTLTPASEIPRTRTRRHVTASRAPDSQHPQHAQHAQHRVGNALRAVKVFTAAVFSVAVLGEYAEEAGVRR